MVTTPKEVKSLSQAIQERRATPSFDGTPIPPTDLRQILEAGLSAPSGYNVQPWRFIVVQSEEQKKRLRAASFNQAKVEEASAVIVACGDADGWRRDLDDILRMGREGGMPEGYAAQARSCRWPQIRWPATSRTDHSAHSDGASHWPGSTPASTVSNPS